MRNHSSVISVTSALIRQGSLKHQLRIHNGEKPFKCTQCDKCFNQAGHLQNHLRIHSGEKPFKSNQCDKHFNQAVNLQTHLRIHSGEKPFKCTQCLLHYNRSFHGDLPHKCSQCSKGFKGGLKRHRCRKLPLEDREKFTCWMCSEFFHNVCGIFFFSYVQTW